MWPEYFPADCPPDEARRDELEVYRLVTENPPSASDFIPLRIEAPHRQFQPERLCMACGVSVFQTAADAEKMRAKYRPLRSRRVARGTITREDGLVLETGQPTHMTWWVQTETPHLRFGEVLSDD